MIYVYVIKSGSSGKIYVGQTDNLEDRIKRHNKSLPIRKKSYTSKNEGPWKLVYKEEYSTRKEATQREKELKSFRGRNFIKSLIRC